MLENRVSFAELASLLGVNLSTLWRIRQGRTSRPTILALAHITGLKAEDLESAKQSSRKKMPTLAPLAHCPRCGLVKRAESA